MIRRALRRLLCGHNSTETVTTRTHGDGWGAVRRNRRCLDCGAEMRP